MTEIYKWLIVVLCVVSIGYLVAIHFYPSLEGFDNMMRRESFKGQIDGQMEGQIEEKFDNGVMEEFEGGLIDGPYEGVREGFEEDYYTENFENEHIKSSHLPTPNYEDGISSIPSRV